MVDDVCVDVCATRAGSGRAGADGTWNLTFEHPSGSQAVVLRLHTSDGTVTGSMSNEQGSTVPIVDGTVGRGSHLDSPHG